VFFSFRTHTSGIRILRIDTISVWLKLCGYHRRLAFVLSDVFSENISGVRRNKINIHLYIYIYYKLGEHSCGLRFRLINRFILAINVLRCVKPITLALALYIYIYIYYIEVIVPISSLNINDSGNLFLDDITTVKYVV